MDFAVPTIGLKLKENEKMYKYQDLARELKKLWNMKVTVTPIIMNALGTVIVNKRTIRDHLNYSIIWISQNTEKSPGDLRWLAVTQTPVRNLELTLVWNTLKGVK